MNSSSKSAVGSERLELERLKRLAFLLALPGVTLLVLLPLYIQEMGGSSELIGLAASVGPLTFAAVRLVGGVATDVFGRKSTFVFGVALYSLGLLMLALAPNADVVALGGSLCGAGAMLAMTSAIVIVADLAGTPEAYGELSSYMALGGVVGAAIPYAFLSLLGDEGFRLSFLVYFAVSVYALLQSLKLPETRPKESKAKFEFSWDWLLAVVVGSLVSFGSGMVTPFFPVYVKTHFNITVANVMVAYAPSAISAVVSPRVAGLLEPLITLVSFNLAGSLGSSLITWPNLAVSAIGFALVTAAVGASSVAQDSLVARSCKLSCGFMVGVYAAVTQGAMGLGSLLAGGLYSASETSVFFLASAAFLAASFLSLAALTFKGLGRKVRGTSHASAGGSN